MYSHLLQNVIVSLSFLVDHERKCSPLERKYSPVERKYCPVERKYPDIKQLLVGESILNHLRFK